MHMCSFSIHLFCKQNSAICIHSEALSPCWKGRIVMCNCSRRVCFSSAQTVDRIHWNWIFSYLTRALLCLFEYFSISHLLVIKIHSYCKCMCTNYWWLNLKLIQLNHVSIQLFNNYLLNAYYVIGIVL